MIRRDRSQIRPPASISLIAADVVAEFTKNQALVQLNDVAGTPWKGWSAQLEFKTYSDNEDVKKSLSDLFANKCAYCESPLDVQDMHTEHFRPKREVHANDDPKQRGYWWLGACWENLLPACGYCNRSPGIDHTTGWRYGSGKGVRFPLLPGSPRAILPGEEALESPVLINPAEDEPSDYFTFRQLSGLSFATINHLPTIAQQIRAMGTMEICGLNHDGLVRQRTTHLKGVAIVARGYVEAAIRLNETIARRAPQATIEECKVKVDTALDDLYDAYLLPSCAYLHATVRCIEKEFWSAGLRLKELLANRELYLPAHNLW
ncbi:hypothetical protein [Pseudomonas cichorii]|uniref:hypothetical protein n=1 Tax=Pseudomonas cichorii TaxID=36746 RepID=UPI001C893D38|nr:hypothetical protein [Pseudomonas cichorii]MBX8485227.1 hypothetical protein [Pseudomonas cichorii]